MWGTHDKDLSNLGRIGGRSSLARPPLDTRKFRASLLRISAGAVCGLPLCILRHTLALKRNGNEIVGESNWAGRECSHWGELLYVLKVNGRGATLN